MFYSDALYGQLNCMLNISETNAFFDRLATEHGVECPPPRTTARLLDKVSLTCLLMYEDIMT